MLTYVLDTSAIVRFLDNEAGADRVGQILDFAFLHQCNAEIAAVNWGEVVYILARRPTGLNVPARALNNLLRSLAVISATKDRCHHAGLLKLKYKIAYADAFGVELASDSPDHILVTADYGAKPAEEHIQIEFLSPKPTPQLP